MSMPLLRPSGRHPVVAGTNPAVGLPPKPAGGPSTFCFSVQAAATPGVMPRVMEFFAKRGLVPHRWVSQVTGPGGRELTLDIQVAGLAPDTGAYIAHCIEGLYDVERVLTTQKA